MIARAKILPAFAAAAILGGATVAATSPAQAWCGYYGCGYGDAALAAGIVGGLAVGAIAASAAHQAQAAREAEARRAYYGHRRAPARKARPARHVQR
ncbi:hypothetical protein [Enterovirga aerilata]|uniref:Uncharacterized protein n=1 Tax=Enterovirga aerilata TaxID=2730920 RepID=A0A849I4X6_9HYPH|nr:hypothetical protein [Enterovirga sp. DB1703]NNM71107.1 hypothetical protein [Enterovirga sp. DB1703]